MSTKTGILVTVALLVAGTPALQAQRAHAGSQAAVATNHPPASASHSTARPSIANLGGSAFPYRSTFATPVGLNPPAASYTGIAPGALRTTGNRYSNYSGRRTFAPVYSGFYGAGFYGVPCLPFVDDSSYYSFPSYSEQAEGVSAQAGAQENAQAQDAMAQEMGRMNDELRMLHESQMQLGVQMQGGSPTMAPVPYGPGAVPQASAAAEQQTEQVPLTLVLQSGATVTVHNYAVMDGVVWDFSRQPARKIPVSTINVPASEKATADSGGDFPSLSASR